MKRILLSSFALVFLVAACGSGKDSTASQELQRQADINAIDQIEKTWHKASTTKDVDLMMTVWAPDATFTADKTYAGTAEIRNFFATQAGAFKPENNWVSDTPAYKTRITVNGNKGTLYFECDYLDVDTQKVANVVAADQEVQKIGGKWLITSSSAAAASIGP